MSGEPLTIDYAPAGEVARAFHQSDAFVRGLMGPVGSSKSSACCLEMFTRACEQTANQGVRRSRWAVIRNTYPELKSTTIKTWEEWFPFARMKWLIIAASPGVLCCALDRRAAVYLVHPCERFDLSSAGSM